MAHRLEQLASQLAPTATAAVAAPVSQPLRFTLDSSTKLSAEQRAHYEKYGFLVIKRLVPPADLERYRKRFVQLCNKEVPQSSMMTLVRCFYSCVPMEKMTNFSRCATCPTPRIAMSRARRS